MLQQSLDQSQPLRLVLGTGCQRIAGHTVRAVDLRSHLADLADLAGLGSQLADRKQRPEGVVADCRSLLAALAGQNSRPAVIAGRETWTADLAVRESLPAGRDKSSVDLAAFPAGQGSWTEHPAGRDAAVAAAAAAADPERTMLAGLVHLKRREVPVKGSLQALRFVRQALQLVLRQKHLQQLGSWMLNPSCQIK